MIPVHNTQQVLEPTAAWNDERSLYQRVRGEFREMPGLRLTLDQAARLFTIERSVCHRVLNQLVRDGVLRTDGSTFLGVTGKRRGRNRCPAKLGYEFARARACRGIGLQAAADDGRKRPFELFRRSTGRRAVEWMAAMQHLAEHDAPGVDVGARIDLRPEQLLGRHIGGRSQRKARARQA